MESYQFLLDVALILVTTKLFGMVTKRFALPQVVGALLAGLVLGPAVFGVLGETSFLDNVAEIGVIVLMFTAGLETDIRELKKSGKASLVIAVIGVLIPLLGGFALAAVFNKGPEAFLQNLFVGVILTATSVSISVETLKELGKLSTRSGNAILGAALIDDVLGIVALTVITSAADQSVSIVLVLLKIVAFFVVSLVAGLLLHRLIQYWTGGDGNDKRRYAVLSFAMCLLFAYCAERFFGVADITGAYVAGLIISNTSRSTYITAKCETLSYMLLSPIFFASIGTKVILPQMTASIALFSVLLMVWAALSKVIGCGLGAKLCRYSSRESLQIGVGMISRGEVALIVATKGMASGLMRVEFFGPILITVVVTTIMTPILLKLAYRGEQRYAGLVQSDLVDQYEEAQDLDAATQAVLDMHNELVADGCRAREDEKTR